MSTHRPRIHLARGAAVTAALGLTLVAGAGIASAHVTANVYGEEPEQGGYGAITLRVPNEEEQAGTTKIEVTVPAEYKISSARTKPMPGWTAKVDKNDSDVVTKVTWSASDGNEIPAGMDSYQEFDLQLGALPADAESILLPTKQTYSDGTVSNWSQPQEGDQEPESPAPVVELAASSGGHAHGADSSHESAGGGHSEAGEAPASATDDTARWLGGAGLLVGALGVGVGAGATLRARKAGKADS